MYITNVEIQNFHSHKRTEVNLSDGINVFVGTSNSGKSAVLRAIRWNLMNLPAGDDFITVGEREACVIVHWSDGHSVERRRSKGGSKNTYTLFKEGEELESYTGFGTRVPQPILDVTGVDPDIKFNFANQLEAPFLLSETPRVRAETVGNLEELGKIDAELVNINNDVRLKRSTQKEKEAALAKLEEEKMELSADVSREVGKVKTINFLKDAIKEKNGVLTELERLIPRLREIREETIELESVITTSRNVINGWDEGLPRRVEEATRLLRLGVRLHEIKKEIEGIDLMGENQLEKLVELTDIVTTLTTNYHRIARLKDQMKRVLGEKDQIENSYSDVIAGISYQQVDSEVEKFSVLFRHNKHLVSVKEEQEKMKKEVVESNERINDLLNQFVEALKESETCPTCYQETENVEKSKIEKII